MSHDEHYYITTGEARRLLDVSTQTLRKWATEGKVRIIRTPSNQRRYHKQDIYNITGRNEDITTKKQVIYARVSSKKQMDDLERQTDFLKSKYPNYTLVTDVGSGINWKRKGLETILDGAYKGTIEEVVVAHKDRLCRFAFELLESIFRRCKVRLVVLDSQEEKSSEQELADDLLAIVHVYACRNMGRRRYKSKKNQIIPHESTEKEAKTMDGDNQICV
jgi:predicted site-specific integrase-resolvase